MLASIKFSWIAFYMHFAGSIFLTAAILLCSAAVFGQQTNPVERQVANPITDTPNINPVSPQQNIAAPKPKPGFDPEGGDGEVVVYSQQQAVQGVEGKRIITYSGNVDVRYGIYRMQADKIVLYEEDGRMEAEGSVVFDQGDDQRITGAKAVWNLKTKLGVFEDSTGFTNQTDDGTVLYFTADRVERVSLDEVVVTKGKFTACDEAVPKWSFTADEARVKANDRVKLKGAKFRLKDVPIIPVPYASIPIKERDRASGFLTPAIGYSANKGLRLSGAYFQTLGRSADVTFRTDVYTSRGLGYGLDLRTRANSRSFFNFGFYAVKDRIFGDDASPENPDQGGSIVYAEGVHYFQNGFTAAADVRLTSNLAFRQVFSDGVQQIISPIEVSQAFVNKSWNNYTLNLLARSQVISIPGIRIKTRNLPSFQFEKRPSMISFLKPLYFSFKAGVEGVSRREEADSVGTFQTQMGYDPVVSPALGQRFDLYPQVTLPINTKYVNFTASGAFRVTYYSNSFNDMRRVVGRDLIRKYGEFEFDVRPVALARNFYGKNNAFKFRHVIEPYLTYRYIKGVDNFQRIIRFDYLDTITDTNEIEFGVINRIYTRKYAEAVTGEAQQRLRDAGTTASDSLSVQPYEIFSLAVRGKYFFDRSFGGALVPGQRNQIASITALSFYTFGGVPRRFSPLNIDMTYRPQRTVFFNARADVSTSGDAVRAVSATVGYDTSFLKIFQTFYYTRAIDLVPSLAQYANKAGKEPGTLRGSQWSPSVFIGNRDKGLYGGASVFFDFENRRATRLSPLISSLYTLGYSGDCCGMAVQYYTFNVGARNENRIVFSFRLNGIGSFGTEQFGQGLR
ncbi:MAG: LPS assembly protein LptD [Pyrinomonadaceae bacterium]|nr:LPS assembly protein LptD [Pyrinomonadaceae bacterium]